MKKIISLAICAVLLGTALTGCTGGSQTSGTGESGTGSSGASGSSFKTSSRIAVLSREDGSGTRGAFIELFGVEQKDDSGNKVDKTVATAEINSDTGVVLTNVASNEYAIGYVSLGALNDTVKALSIDGAAATVENIKSGTYKIARPFNIATGANVSAVAQDFIDFILSSDGQKVVTDKGYIALDNTKAYSGTKPSGKVTVSGSSSITPLMEKLKEAYLKINQNATVEIQQSDSSSGMTDVAGGISDIGMASRELKDSELAKGITPTKICMDGIAVIVNKTNTATGLTKDQVMKIYTGEFTKWSDVIG